MVVKTTTGAHEGHDGGGEGRADGSVDPRDGGAHSGGKG